MYAIETHDLTRIFRKRRSAPFSALDCVSLAVDPGQIFGLLGPNGAGKTTLIKILATLLYPTRGWARVDGIDVVREPRRVRPIINMVAGGETPGYGILSVRENLWMFSQFYGIPTAVASARIEHYLERFELTEDGDTKCNKLSTGMRQKMNLIRAFITEPKVLFLDEPTIGMDAHIARRVRRFIAQWVRDRPDRTILLTTHYMTEAEELCRTVAIIDRGRIVASDTPENLHRELGGEGRFRLTVADGDLNAAALGTVAGLSGCEETTPQSADGLRQFVFHLASDGLLSSVLDFCRARGGRIMGFSKDRPSLEDLFIRIVGRRLSDEE